MRPNWDEYFLNIAKLAASRSTCLVVSIGAVVVKDNQIIATGYNGVPSGVKHCTELEHCSEVGKNCSESSLPSRAIHAEANAIAQAAKHGKSCDGATIYITHSPCINCLKLIVAAGIKWVIYENNHANDNCLVRKEYLNLVQHGQLL